MKASRKGLKKRMSNIDPLNRDLASLMSQGNWQRVRFELQPKNKTVTLRLSEELLKAIKYEAKKSGLEYQKFIRIALERLTEGNE